MNSQSKQGNKGSNALFIFRKKGEEDKMEGTQLKALAAEIKFTPRCELVQGEGIPKLYLYGQIVEEIPRNWWTGEPESGDYITMEEVKKSFAEIKGDEVEIHINSRGGNVYTSVAISNYLKDSAKKITIIVDAIAASGGSIITMGGDKIKMYPNSLMMIHRASCAVYGNAEDLRKVADSLEKFDSAVHTSYLQHFKGTSEELKAMIYEETYLTAEECLTLGLCDEIIEKPIEAKEEVKNESAIEAKNSILEKYRNKETDKAILSKFRR
jgi:ATP-dependent protease ClpP protease subunit